MQEQKQQEEDVTSSIKDDVSSPIEQLSPLKSPESLIEEPVKPENLPLEIIETAEIHEDISKREVRLVRYPIILDYTQRNILFLMLIVIF